MAGGVIFYLKEIFSPWLKKQKLAGWGQVLLVELIHDDNKIVIQRAGEQSMVANDVIFILSENELTIEIKTRKEQFFQEIIFFIIFLGAADLKGFCMETSCIGYAIRGGFIIGFNLRHAQ